MGKDVDNINLTRRGFMGKTSAVIGGWFFPLSFVTFCPRCGKMGSEKVEVGKEEVVLHFPCAFLDRLERYE